MSQLDSQFRSLSLGDLDGDNRLDVSSSLWGNGLRWYRNNDGKGNFGPGQLISEDNGFAAVTAAGDLDGDGDLDVLSDSSNEDEVAWYENIDGAGNFGPRHNNIENN